MAISPRPRDRWKVRLAVAQREPQVWIGDAVAPQLGVRSGADRYVDNNDALGINEGWEHPIKDVLGSIASEVCHR